MAKFEDHIIRAKSNLSFLHRINQSANSYWDWQVTVSFYVGVHLINSHLVKKLGVSFYSHTDTLKSINFETALSVARLPQIEYLAYRKLYNLSRRSRYLCIDADSAKSGDLSVAYLTHSRHLDKAVTHVDILLKYITANYSENFDTLLLELIEIQSKALQHFKYQKIAS